MIDALVLDARDHVATVLRDVAAGERIVPSGPSGPLEMLQVGDAVATGHKVALVDIGAGEEVRKYGEVIGLARSAIGAGRHVHVHNLASRRAQG